MSRFIIVSAAFMLSCVAASAATPAMPPEVMAHFEDMKKYCREVGDPLKPSNSFLISADLNGDGQTDWAIDEAGFNCDGAATLFSGASGSGQVYVFAGMSGNRARQVFTHGAGGMRLERSTTGPNRLWILVGGVLCGQTGSFSNSDAIICERPLAWNKATKQFEFAPLSTIKVPNHLPVR